MNLGPAEIILLAWLVVPGALLVIAVTRNRPSATRFAAVNGLDLDPPTEAAVAEALAATRRSRVRGAWAGVAGGVVTGWTLQAVVGIRTSWVTSMCVIGGILVGTFVGVAAAQRAPRRELGATRRASLTVRDVDAYRTRHGTAMIQGAAIAFLVAAARALVATRHDVLATIGAVAILTAAAFGFLVWTNRLAVQIVQRGRDTDHPLALAVDDAFRASAVRSIQHATVGALAVGIGLLALVGINTQSYEAVVIDGRTVFTVPDDGHLDEVVTADITALAGTTTPVTIHWTDGEGAAHTATRLRPPGVYLGSGTYFETDAAIGIGGLALTLGWIVGVVQWSGAAKAWRRPAAPRLEAV